MNIQTDPARISDAAPLLPAAVDTPIRFAPGNDFTLQALGYDLASGRYEPEFDLYELDLRKRATENADIILSVVTYLGQAQQNADPITPAAEWLLDNHYLVEDTIVQVRRDLPASFFRKLPVTTLPDGRRVPRALVLAWTYVAHSDSAISVTGFETMVAAFQEVEPLAIGELWALPSLLRFVLVENLRRLAVRVKRAHEMRDVANKVADQALAQGSVEEELRVLATYEAHARDTTFATQLLFRLRDGTQYASSALAWLETELEKFDLDAEEIARREHATLSAGNVTTGNIIKGLRLVDDTDWTVWFEELSHVDRMLRAHTDFADLDFHSRDQYRRSIEELAGGTDLTEGDVTERAIAMAEDRSTAFGRSAPPDIGLFVVGPKRPELEHAIGYTPQWPTRIRRFYKLTSWAGIVVPAALLTAVLLAAVGFTLGGIGLPTAAVILLLALFFLPASEAAFGLYNTIASLIVEPTRLIGYEYKEGVPDDARTLVALPILIGSRDDVEDALHNLEVHYLANMQGELDFALLSDWKDSESEQTTEDAELLDYAQKRVFALNERYPRDARPRFHVLHRRRLYNDAEGVWMGWERKRGKLHELNALLRGDLDTTFIAPTTPLPENVQFVLTLDADTRMTRDAVAKLVGKLSHPLNRPVIDGKTGRIVSGYGILQPRVTPSLTTGNEASFFQRIFSANRGVDPYVFAVSDVYQDLFDSGTFTGKGLYHVDAMEAALKDRIGENAVLSHDLLEGAYARCALVTDVELIEDYPTQYSVDASRNHRWIRGDWQLLPFIFEPGSGVPGLSRFKMIDNLRRSLTPISWVLASIAGWMLLPFAYAVQWQALLILSLVLALTYSIVDALMPRDSEATLRSHFSALGREIAFATGQVVLKVVLIAHQAWSSADAILRTLYRMFVSRRHLLEWRTASDAARSGSEDLASYYAMMIGSVVIALVGFSLAVIADHSGAVVAGLFLLFWSGAPAFAWLISRSAETEDKLVVDPVDAAKLRTAARRTWLYYETFVTSEHNFLPPDNYQEIPMPVVASRTSPTNVGIYLLSIVSARDFGWISLAEAVHRIEQTITTIEKMERHRGHLYNWYDTKTLKPLLPLYVSSVDSGNLAGHLVTVAATCNIWAQAPAAHLQGDYTGILDNVTILAESLDELPDDRRPLRPLRQRLRERIDGMRRAVETIRREPETAAIRTINLAVLTAEIRKLARAIHEEIGSQASETLALWADKLDASCQSHISDSYIEDDRLASLRSKLVELRDRSRKYAFEMDFSFLMRGDRKLLSIGYRVDQRQLDEACYDLLASEARLTSLFAIAKGDVPTDHWMRLGRPITLVGFYGALVSWSGSMFEYLMPPLVMKEPLGGILNQTNNLIITRQIRYARAKGIPWGISESAYNARDREMTYQYTNFGVPGLGLKRGLSQNTVIAPYATLLAAQFKPREAVANLAELELIGGRGRYGYYDAIDFTPTRVPTGSDHAVVRNYMAHHTGMSIVAVANVIFEGRMRDRFHSDAVIEAAELLLQEKAPRDVPATKIRAEAGDRISEEEIETSSDIRVIADPVNALPATTLMSNGYYSVMLTARGTGYSRSGEISVTRWSGDPIEDRSGTFLFVTDTATGAWWSATGDPKSADGESCEAVFSDDKATFVKRVGTLTAKVEAIVVAEANGEARRITITNHGDTDRHLEITSFGEIALAPEASDQAHPAFSKMFVETTIANDGSLILARRNKRAEGEAPVALAHFVTAGAGIAREARAETDRRVFLGRGRSIVDPAAFDHHGAFGGTEGFTLDPIMSIRCKVRVPAGKEVSLTYWTLVAATEEDARASAIRFDNPGSFERQAMLAWTRSQVQTRHVGLSLADAAGVQRLARYLLYPDPALRAPAELIADGLGRQSALWPTSISGDFPIFALRIADVADLEIVSSALRMQEYLRTHGMVTDLVIVNEQAASYVQDLQQAIEQLCDNSRLRGRELGPRQHIFAVRRDLMDDETYKTLLSVARVVLHTRNGTIFDQIDRAEATAQQAWGQRLSGTAKPAVRLLARLSPVATANGDGLEYWNGYGGFADKGSTYVVRLDGKRHTPQPWINVIANENFGFHVSAEGAAFTWSRNSRDFQVTPWSNDPVTNRPGEGVYIVDRDTGDAFSPLAAMLRDPSLVYEARHGAGLSAFQVERNGLDATLEHLVDPSDPVRISRLKITNRGTTPSRLRVYAYVEWVMGVNRTRTSATTIPGHDASSDMVTARNPYHLDYGDRVAFLAGDRPSQSFTCDRGEFLGTSGCSERPAAVISGASLGRTVEAGRDICGAIAFDIDIPAGGEEALQIYMGDAGSAAEARELVQHHRSLAFDDRLAGNARQWTEFADALQIETPDPAFDALVNHWLPYQAFACRIRARAAFYQASGAYGFRDQLQDTLALLLQDSSLARAQILNAAGRQFREGDVQHWWLPLSGAGVRTMISDDVVWLAHGTHRYVSVTGDEAILDESLPFLEGAALEEGQHDAFYTPQVSSESASLFEHCARALDLAIRRTGPNGLPLILGGDWNDGMNRVGEQGRGESVWLGWFLAATLRDFAPIAAKRGDTARADSWTRHLDRLTIAIEEAGWDGEWYRRGYFDDGSPLGSRLSDECRIDSLAQSWAVLSGLGPTDRANRAMTSAQTHLIDETNSLIRLFTPPFQKTLKEPGYIKGYPPGVRENGGQYTHAATWFVLALAALGRSDDAYHAFSLINPVNHAGDQARADLYRVEPYVVAADVYSESDRAGRGGWTWYTGSAGWLYRAAVEGIIGLDVKGDAFSVSPRIPANWKGFKAKLKIRNARYDIVVERGEADSILFDGTQVQQIPIWADGNHEVVVTVAKGDDG
ncbi:protein ndvB [Aliihoeflea aestuarii]|uniref:GH36-type glycosyl hydrolase domain-containing protein n=1 Tax=Aliihoeflea aestuarii TaxID=453840 RepID=UPI0020931514|nr:glucoamylase family protein [Aliihoeflea aestuarii]MCO6390187.1 protein ndvB [Aliihoeflea aestuarii]